MKLEFAAIALLGLLPAACRQRHNAPLWPGAPFTESDREASVRRATAFLRESTLTAANFNAFPSDALWCWYTIHNTTADEALRREAANIGRVLAKRYREDYGRVPGNTPDAVSARVDALQALEAFGQADPNARATITRLARQFSARDFLEFDPASEGIPSDIPDSCARCGFDNPRGATVCARCRTRLRMLNRFEVWMEALVETYSGDRCGIRLGASYADVARLRDSVLPYPHPENTEDPEWIDAAYAITHVVYTTNDYGLYLVSRQQLHPEFEFLSRGIPGALKSGDAALIGEFVDTLLAFDVPLSDTLLRPAVTYLLEHQKPDGSWADVTDTPHNRFHTAWAGVNALQLYRRRGYGAALPRLPSLPGFAR